MRKGANGREVVAGVAPRAHGRQQVFRVRRLEKPQAAVFHERHLALRQLHLQQVAVACASEQQDRKSTRLNSSHSQISYAVFCLKKKKNKELQASAYE